MASAVLSLSLFEHRGHGDQEADFEPLRQRKHHTSRPEFWRSSRETENINCIIHNFWTPWSRQNIAICLASLSLYEQEEKHQGTRYEFWSDSCRENMPLFYSVFEADDAEKKNIAASSISLDLLAEESITEVLIFLDLFEQRGCREDEVIDAGKTLSFAWSVWAYLKRDSWRVKA